MPGHRPKIPGPTDPQYCKRVRYLQCNLKTLKSSKTCRSCAGSKTRNAEALVKTDKEVLATGTPHYIHEHVDHSDHGKATLSVCKWVDELDGRRLVFGISFIIPG